MELDCLVPDPECIFPRLEKFPCSTINAQQKACCPADDIATVLPILDIYFLLVNYFPEGGHDQIEPPVMHYYAPGFRRENPLPGFSIYDDGTPNGNVLHQSITKTDTPGNPAQTQGVPVFIDELDPGTIEHRLVAIFRIQFLYCIFDFIREPYVILVAECKVVKIPSRID